MPPVQQIELDGDDIPFAPGCEGVVKIPGELLGYRSTGDQNSVAMAILVTSNGFNLQVEPSRTSPRIAPT